MCPSEDPVCRGPVVFYIHGGFFLHGDANVNPMPLVNSSMILVAPAYRLNALGFFSTGDEAAPGNFGLKDLRTALLWVHDNIRYFGGEPRDITLIGHDTGAAAAELMMVTKNAQTNQHFRRVFAMSGSLFAPFSLPLAEPLRLAQKHAKVLNVTNADSISTTDLVKAMRQFSAEEIVNSIEDLKKFDIDPVTLYGVVVEKDYLDAFLIEDPRELIRQGNYLKVNMLKSCIEQEGTYRSLAFALNAQIQKEFVKNRDKWLPQVINLQMSDEFIGDLVKYYWPHPEQMDHYDMLPVS